MKRYTLALKVLIYSVGVVTKFKAPAGKKKKKKNQHYLLQIKIIMRKNHP